MHVIHSGLTAEKLCGTVCDHFVCIHVVTCPRSRLERLDNEFSIPLAIHDFLSRLRNCLSQLPRCEVLPVNLTVIKQSQFKVHERGRTFHRRNGPNECAPGSQPADGEVFHCALSLHTEQCRCRDVQLAERIFFFTKIFWGHEVSVCHCKEPEPQTASGDVAISSNQRKSIREARLPHRRRTGAAARKDTFSYFTPNPPVHFLGKDFSYYNKAHAKGNNLDQLLQLFWIFLKVNLLSTSGPASIGLLYHEVVGKLITEGQFVQAVGLSSVLPGSDALQLAMYIGYAVAGVPGGFVALTASILPPTLIILGVTMILHRLRREAWLSSFIE